MSNLIFTVIEPFFLSIGGGELHVVTDLTEIPPSFKSGSVVEIIGFNGSKKMAKCWIVRSTSNGTEKEGKDKPLSFFLEGLRKDDVAPGTQVWTSELNIPSHKSY